MTQGGGGIKSLKPLLIKTAAPPSFLRAGVLTPGGFMIRLAIKGLDTCAVVDAEYGYLSKYMWRISENGYVFRYSERRISLAHQIMGTPPKGFVVDHINRDKLDNRKANLRIIEARHNAQNVGPQKRNRTKIRGVTFRKDTGRYLAACGYEGKFIRLGYFDNPKEAEAVVKKFRKDNLPYSME